MLSEKVQKLDLSLNFLISDQPRECVLFRKVFAYCSISFFDTRLIAFNLKAESAHLWWDFHDEGIILYIVRP